MKDQTATLRISIQHYLHDFIYNDAQHLNSDAFHCAWQKILNDASFQKDIREYFSQLREMTPHPTHEEIQHGQLVFHYPNLFSAENGSQKITADYFYNVLSEEVSWLIYFTNQETFDALFERTQSLGFFDDPEVLKCAFKFRNRFGFLNNSDLNDLYFETKIIATEQSMDSLLVHILPNPIVLKRFISDYFFDETLIDSSVDIEFLIKNISRKINNFHSDVLSNELNISYESLTTLKYNLYGSLNCILGEILVQKDSPYIKTWVEAGGLISYMNTESHVSLHSLLESMSSFELDLTSLEDFLYDMTNVNYSGHCIPDIHKKAQSLSNYFTNNGFPVNLGTDLLALIETHETPAPSPSTLDILNGQRYGKSAEELKSSRWSLDFWDQGVLIATQLLLENLDSPQLKQWQEATLDNGRTALHSIILHSLYYHPSLLRTHAQFLADYYWMVCTTEEKEQIFNMTCLLLQNAEAFTYETTAKHIQNKAIQQWMNGHWDMSNGGPLVTFFNTLKRPFPMENEPHPLIRDLPFISFLAHSLREKGLKETLIPASKSLGLPKTERF